MSMNSNPCNPGKSPTLYYYSIIPYNRELPGLVGFQISSLKTFKPLKTTPTNSITPNSDFELFSWFSFFSRFHEIWLKMIKEFSQKIRGFLRIFVLIKKKIFFGMRGR